jgi:hypothetical protein
MHNRDPIYRTWEAMHDRTSRKDGYVKRGIGVCEEWATFGAFREYALKHLGPRPRGMSLDRIDNNKGYEPGNVRWATATEQQRNTTFNHLIEANGEVHCVAEWAEINDLTAQVICRRLARGWRPDLAVTTPRRKYGDRV